MEKRCTSGAFRKPLGRCATDGYLGTPESIPNSLNFQGHAAIRHGWEHAKCGGPSLA